MVARQRRRLFACRARARGAGGSLVSGPAQAGRARTTARAASGATAKWRAARCHREHARLAWPLCSVAISLVSATALAALHRQIDLGTYLLGGAHVFRPDLYRVTYEPTALGFTYPRSPLWFAPLAHLPVRLVQVLFTWASSGALSVVLATSLRVTCPSLRRRTVGWWSLLLLAPIGMLDPPRETILLGQINILLVAAVIADMTLVRPGRRGVLVGLAAAIKIIPLILIPYLLLTRRVGAWRRAAGAFVVAAGLAFATSPHASWAYWSRYLWDPGRMGGLAWIGNQGAVGVIERLVHHPLSSLAMFALVVVISGIGLLIAVKAYRQSWAVLGFLAVEATGAVATPVSWSHHFVWVVLLIAWLALAHDRPAHGEWWAAGVVVVFWAAPFWWVPHGTDVTYAGHGWSIPLSDSFFVVLPGILLATALRLFRRRARRSPPLDTMAPPRFRDGLVADPELAGELRDASSLRTNPARACGTPRGRFPAYRLIPRVLVAALPPSRPRRTGGASSRRPFARRSDLFIRSAGAKRRRAAGRRGARLRRWRQLGGRPG